MKQDNVAAVGVNVEETRGKKETITVFSNVSFIVIYLSSILFHSILKICCRERLNMVFIH